MKLTEDNKAILEMMLTGQKSLSRELSYHILAIKTVLIKHGLVSEEDYERLRIAAIAAVDQQYEEAAKRRLAEYKEEWPDARDFFEWLESQNIL